MRLIFLLVLIIGIGTAGYAAFLIQGQFTGYQERVVSLENEVRKTREQIIETTPVVVAAQQMSFAHRLTAEDLKIVEWPAVNMPEGVFTNVEDVLGSPSQDIRYVTRRVEPGEPILNAKVTRMNQDIGLTTLLDPGTQAATIQVNALTGVSGFLHPGDNVDIYWTGNSLDQQITKQVYQNILIIAVDQKADTESIGPTLARTVTVQVSPQIVANLIQLQSTGTLSLSLRGELDDTLTDAIETNTSEIIGRVINEVEVAPVCTRTIRKGTEITVEEVPCPPGGGN